MLAMPFGLIRFKALNECVVIEKDPVGICAAVLLKKQYMANKFTENVYICYFGYENGFIYGNFHSSTGS